MSVRRKEKLVRRAGRKDKTTFKRRVRAAGFELATALIFDQAAKQYAAEHPDEEGSKAILYPEGEPTL